MHLPQSKDIDIEIFHLSTQQILNVLAPFGEVFISGQSFPVIKIKGHPQWDFTAPEKPELSFYEASQRRDFTINTMLMDILTGEIIDELGAQRDIANKIIRPVSPEVMKNDPLRAYRACQLAARLSFALHPDTIAQIADADLKGIKAERIYEEFCKLLMLSARPSIGLRYMQTTGILESMHPSLFSLIGCQQSPLHHPEGDVWEHTLLVVDEAARLKVHSHYPLALMFAALLHDTGKPQSTRIKGEKITAYGHDVLGVKVAEDFLRSITSNARLINAVCTLTREHMHPVLLYKDKDRVSDKALRKLINRVDFNELMLLAEADFKGRTVEKDFSLVRDWFNHRFQLMGVNPERKIEPLIKGQDLLELGYHPGKELGRMLDLAFELQLEGKNREEILSQINESRGHESRGQSL
jgi:tRNA nucleotidyltransferase (CCA-adding enzyme)